MMRTQCNSLAELNRELKRKDAGYSVLYMGFGHAGDIETQGYQVRMYLIEVSEGYTIGNQFHIRFNDEYEDFDEIVGE